MTKLNAKPSARGVLTGVRRRTLGAAIAMALVGGLGSQAQAFEFASDSGDWTGTLDTQLSYGVSMRVQGRADDLIGKANLNPLIGTLPLAQQIAAPGRFSVNSDDGDLNYDKGKLFSNAAKITSELSLNYKQDSGLFVRATYFYDWANNNKAKLTELAEEKVGTNLTLLDAFVFHNFDFNGKQGSARLGRQVVSWGESTFIQGGINSINPIDVSKLRVAGAELKEAFLPVDMAFASFEFAENLSAEALYLTEFEQTEPDPRGTYFGTNDFGSLGSDFVVLGFGRANEPASLQRCQLGLVSPATDPLGAASCGATVPRSPDRMPSDQGQYGAAVHYFAPDLHDTEFGFFYLNYHSRLPLANGIAVTNTSPTSGRYFIEYPEDIHLWGASFNTMLNGPGVALQGEISYRSNQPFQIDDVELLFAALTPLNAFTPSPGLRFHSQLGEFAPGAEIRGYERLQVSQIQTTATKVFGPNNWLGAEQLATVLEVGATNVWDLPKSAILRFQGDGTDTGGGFNESNGDLRNPVTQTGFPTRFSWGYRLAMRADYNNVWGTAFNLSPRVAFSHDVNGITPGPGGNFIENRKSGTLGVEANYLSKWAVDLSYSAFWGAGNLNLIRDRDFAAFTVKYSF
ncbi:MAG: hypothetical protein COS34_07680 [Lysobacterales bacterium CG02_land_8_20_14_3_00_62_12]|nr:MAG: hypothetical protein COS34_07680 [Xanthomonadales bacterium CG02_land_8_20_14_3_00_62_12]